MKQNPKANKTEPHFDQEFGAPFSLDDLDADDRFSQLMSYEGELVTANEKAAYYDMLAKNGGQPDARKVAGDCRRRAAVLRKKRTGIPDNVALQLNNRAKALEEYAEYLSGEVPEDVVPEDVVAAQREHDENPESQGGQDYTQTWLAEFLPKTDAQKADFWRKVHDWDRNTQVLYYYAKPESVSRNEVLFVRAQKDPFAIKLLSQQARTQMSCLLELAEMGNTDAAREAASLIKDMVQRLNTCALGHVETFKPVAKIRTEWPVIHSLQFHYREDANALCRELELGKDYRFNVDPTAKWDPNELGCRVAILLFDYIEAVRARPEIYKTFSFCTAATELPPSKDSGAGLKWWLVAKNVLLDAVPEPAADERLSLLAQGEETQKYKSRIGQRILARLKARFLQLFYKENR